MPPDEGATPDPPAMDPATEPATGSDEAVAQNHFDEWSANIEHQIGELRQSMAHLIASQSGAAGHGQPTGQTPAESGAAARQGAAAGGGTGVSLGDDEDFDDYEPEQSPKSAHRWWRPLRG